MPFFRDRESLLHTAIGTVIACAYLLRLVCASGKRTLSKENAHGLIITVALGSTFASVATSSTTPLANGAVTLLLLIGLQSLLAWAVLRWDRLDGILKGRPRAVFLRGRFLEPVLTHERVARDAVLAAIRQAGILDLARVRAVVLETEGSFSVLPEPEQDVRHSSLQDVEGMR